MVNVAIEATRKAGNLTHRYFKHARNKSSYFEAKQKVSYKADGSPVTLADVEAEKTIRKIISQKFPDHGFIGEELGRTNPSARFKWVINPIDGTKQFIRGLLFGAPF